MKRKWFVYLIALLAAVYALYQKETVMNIAGVLIYTTAFSLLLSPAHTAFCKRGCSDHHAAALSVFLCLILIAALFLSFLPYLILHTVEMFRRCTPVITAILRNGEIFFNEFGLSVLRLEKLAEPITELVSSATSALARGGISLAEEAGRMFFALVLSYYVLCEKKRIVNHLVLCLPLSRRLLFLSLLQGCRNAVMGYTSGLLKTSAFIGACTYAVLALLGIKDAFLLALFMGLFEILPYIGPVIAAIPILLSAIELGYGKVLITLGALILVQQIEGNFVSPYFTASSTSVGPLEALISVYVFGSFFGLWGILLAIPFVVVLRSALWSLRQMMNLTKA